MTLKKLPNGKWQYRWRDDNGVQRAKNDTSKEALRDFIRQVERGEIEARRDGKAIGVLIGDYQASTAWSLLDYPTQILYRRIFDRWFDLIADVRISELDPKRLSQWIADMKENADRFGRSKQRKSFQKELNLLKSLLTWYEGYGDDPSFTSPIRARHEDESWIERSYTKTEDGFAGQVSDEIPLTEVEFEKFRAELLNGKFGETMAILADTQFDHSLRICEAAAVMWTDFKAVAADWSDGEIKFQRHVQYVHQARGTFDDKIAPGLKNRRAVKRKGQRFSRRNALSKTNPFFPRSTKGLRQLFLRAVDKKGLVFVNPETGSFFTYKCIKDKYDRAFKRAGLTYTGTHIVRYGGVNNFIESYGADNNAAMELLGNESEGRYILKRPTLVRRALKAKEPSASEVHSALADQKNASNPGHLERNGGMDGLPPSLRKMPYRIAE